MLNEVVRGSERLTILIFCDGETKISGTPYDAGINQFFQQKLAEQKSAHQPFVIVLRSQLGKYASCAMGLPPQPVTFPEFPPLPAPPPVVPVKAVTKLTHVPPKAVTNTVPSLIIIGTKIESSPLPLPASPTNAMPMTNQSVKIQAAPSSVVSTNPAAALVIPTNQAAAKINASIAPLAGSVSGGEKFLFIGVGLLVIVLGMIVRLRSQRKDASLITRSMTDRR
jgi:hypothetical protein